MKFIKLITVAIITLQTNFIMADVKQLCSLSSEIDPDLTLVDAIGGIDTRTVLHRVANSARYDVNEVVIDTNPLNLVFQPNQKQSVKRSNNISCVTSAKSKSTSFKIVGEQKVTRIVWDYKVSFYYTADKENVTMECDLLDVNSNSKNDTLKVTQLPIELRQIVKVPCENLAIPTFGNNPSTAE